MFFKNNGKGGETADLKTMGDGYSMVKFMNVSACLNSIRSTNLFKPFATFFFFMSHFQSRNNIMDRSLTSSVSYLRLEYHIESRFTNRRRPTHRRHSSQRVYRSTFSSHKTFHCRTVAAKINSQL